MSQTQDMYRVDPLPDRPGYRLDVHRLRARCWWTVFGCGVTAALFAVIAVVQIAMLGDVVLPMTQEWQNWLVGEDCFAIATAASLATAIIWLAWLFRAVANLKAVSAPAMTWSPRAAVLWNLIPIINLIMGFFILRAVWRGSFRRTDTAPLLVSASTISAIAGLMIALLPAIASGDLAAVDVRADTAANALQTLTCALQAFLVLQITRAQAMLTHIADTFA